MRSHCRTLCLCGNHRQAGGVMIVIFYGFLRKGHWVGFCVVAGTGGLAMRGCCACLYGNRSVHSCRCLSHTDDHSQMYSWSQSCWCWILFKTVKDDIMRLLYDTWLHQSEPLSSGLLPDLIGDDVYSCMSSFGDWLSRWLPANVVTSGRMQPALLES